MTNTHYDELQIFIDEFNNISPETTNTFIFDKNGEIIAKDETTTEDQTKTLISSFNGIMTQDHGIGGIENLTIQGADSQLNVTALNSLFLASVSSRAADQKIVKSFTHVLIPTVIGLLDQITPETSENAPSQVIEPQDEPGEEKVSPTVPEESQNAEPTALLEAPVSFNSEPFLPQPPVNQFMVEKIGGILVPTDTVRIDDEIVAKWSDLYDGKKITTVSIQTLEGKTTTCKFKPIKETKNKAKGIIQIPEKILQTLQISKGKLVMVKPVIEGDSS